VNGAQNYGTSSLTPPNGKPVTVTTAAPYESGPMPAGFGALFVTLKSTKAGALNVQRWADAAMTVPVGAVITVALVADTQKSVQSIDGVPYLFFSIEITNTGSGDAAITNFAALTGPLP
jgi:hypothetical protein